MEMSFDHAAPDRSVFAPGSFASQVGKEVPVRLPGAAAKTGRIVAAEVAQDGRSVAVTLDVDVQVPPYGAGSFSLA